jgi:hypothetical protein
MEVGLESVPDANRWLFDNDESGQSAVVMGSDAGRTPLSNHHGPDVHDDRNEQEPCNDDEDAACGTRVDLRTFLLWGNDHDDAA